MYIDRKTEERVEAKQHDENIMAVKTGNGEWILMTIANFNEQYGEAMICPDTNCRWNKYNSCEHNKPHIKAKCDEAGHCPACIPYVPEKQSEPESDLGEYEYCCGIASPEAQAKMEQKEKETNKPKIVCLCGSTRFSDAFIGAFLEETLAGKIVLTVGNDWRDNRQWQDIDTEKKIMLDELHLRKIDLADEVLILNVGGYIGESTSRELAYAQKMGKQIRYLEAIK
jgi:hypothetical protein